MDTFEKMVEKIIQEQEGIIGPVALEQARKVNGLKIDWSKHQVAIEGDETNILGKLVEQYQYLFGRTSVEVCKNAVRNLISEVPQEKLPALLR